MDQGDTGNMGEPNPLNPPPMGDDIGEKEEKGETGGKDDIELLIPG